MDEKYRFNREVVSIEEAIKRIEPIIRPLEKEQVCILDAHHRFLAEAVRATHSLPHFSRSAMDGFAITAEGTTSASVENPVYLQVVEEIPTGTVPQQIITPRTAARIMTGAMLPNGADAVVKLESVELLQQEGQNRIRFREPIFTGSHVVPEGLELREGDLVIEKGRRIESAELALLAMFGNQKVKVHKKPRVAIFATGSELLELDQPIEKGKIRDSNSYLLYGLIRDAGGIPILNGIIPDNLTLAKECIDQTLPIVDMIITIGGVSVGDFDIMSEFFSSWNGEMLYNKVAMRPGSPTTVGVRDGKFLFALSGNPSSCFVGFQLFVRPVLLGMQGANNIHLTRVQATLEQDTVNPTNYTRLVRGQYRIKEGVLYAHVVGTDHSSVTTSLKDTHCLIMIPDHEMIVAGKQVEVILIK